MDFLVRLAPVLIIVLGVPWFWRHCAKPCLMVMRARPTAMRLVLGLSIAASVAAPIDLLTWAIAPNAWAVVRPLAFVISAVYAVVVAIGYLNEYRILIRMTGGPLLSRSGSTTEPA